MCKGQGLGVWSRSKAQTIGDLLCARSYTSLGCVGRGSWAMICGCMACWADVDSGKGGKSSLGMEKVMEGDRDNEIDR